MVKEGGVPVTVDGNHLTIEGTRRVDEWVESIYMKLVLYEHRKDALLFENELNRFAAEHGLTVRMSFGKLIRNDFQTKLSPTELIDLYKLFISGIQNDKLSRMFEPRVFKGLMEGLYRNADPEIRAMIWMSEFFEIGGINLLDMFGQPNGATTLDTKELLSPTSSRSA